MQSICERPRRAFLLEDSNYQTESRVDLHQRWNLINEYLDDDAHNVLDIGCKEGELTRLAADKGLFSLGIERRAMSIDEAYRLNDEDRPSHFIQCQVGPETVKRLPRFDVMFLLTVYYYWILDYGWETAEAMLRELAGRTDQLFFETANSASRIESPTVDGVAGDSIAERYCRYLETVLGDEATVEYLGTVDYKGGDRDDVFYVIDCSSLQ